MMLRASALSLVLLSSLAAACVAPPAPEGDEPIAASATSEAPLTLTTALPPTYPTLYPPLTLPPGWFVPAWATCEDGSRAPRVLVNPTGTGTCPAVTGNGGAWYGRPVAKFKGSYCSYSWHTTTGALSQFSLLEGIAQTSNITRFESEIAPAPRKDVRADCMPTPSPCIANSLNQFACEVVTAVPVVPGPNRTLAGMVPCGACGQGIGGNQLLVILPEFYTRSPYNDPNITVTAGTALYSFVPPAGDQSFIVTMPTGTVSNGAYYNVGY